MRPGGCIFKVDTGFGVRGTIIAPDVAKDRRLLLEFFNGSSLAFLSPSPSDPDLQEPSVFPFPAGRVLRLRRFLAIINVL